MALRVERRAFLQGALLGLLPLAHVACGETPASAVDESSPRRFALVERSFAEGGLDRARTIGRWWLDTTAPGASPEQIAALVQPTVDLIDSSPDDAAALEALGTRIRTDFTTGSSPNVDGWTFAETELHLCVLAVMHA